MSDSNEPVTKKSLLTQLVTVDFLVAVVPLAFLGGTAYHSVSSAVEASDSNIKIIESKQNTLIQQTTELNKIIALMQQSQESYDEKIDDIEESMIKFNDSVNQAQKENQAALQQILHEVKK